MCRVLQEPTSPAFSHAIVTASEAGPCSTQCHLLRQLQQLWCEGGIGVWRLSPCFSWCLVGADSFLWGLSHAPWKYFHQPCYHSGSFSNLTPPLFDIIGLSLSTGKVPKQFNNNSCFFVAEKVISRIGCHWSSGRNRTFSFPFPFLKIRILSFCPF